MVGMAQHLLSLESQQLTLVEVGAELIVVQEERAAQVVVVMG
jgi:hypothetical protein